MEYELVSGLEVHCQLNTHTKAFCGCSTAFGAPANTNVCPVCLAMPGSLPVLNARALESIIKMGLATNCRIAPYSTMARKNYFYPDLPKGYQISQFEDPVCSEGFVEVDTGDAKQSSLKKIRLVRIHLEEDAGKSIHDIGAETYVDANRCGVPLIEIVSYPDIRSTREASLYLQKIRQIVRYLGISDGNMDEGSLRCDANVSVRPKGQAAYGTRTEIKNMNSFKSVEKAMEYEVLRQTEVLESGGRVAQETLLWDADKMETRPMRSKEQAHDYRYFPEPDLVPIEVTSKMLEQITSSLPEFPEARRDRFVAEYKLPRYDAEVLTASRDIADYFEATVKTSGDAKQSSNWVMGEVLRTLKEKAIDVADFSIDARRLGELITLYNGGTVSSTVAKEVFALMMESKDAPSKIVNDRGLAQVSDNAAIETAVAEIIAANPSQREQYRSGKKNLFGYFVGETMKQMSGKANPKLITDILKQKLDAA